MANETDLEMALTMMTEPPQSPSNTLLMARGVAPAMARNKRTVFDWLYKAGITGIGIAERTCAGTRLKGDLALKIYVERKRPERKLDFVIPKRLQFAGLPTLETDVEEIGKIELHSNTARVRPAPPGFSIGLATQPQEAGTFGLVVRKKGATGGPYYLLSNSHAIAASGWANKGDKIVQPGCYDGGAVPADIIASLNDWVPFQYTDTGFPNTVDCAIAELEAGVATTTIAQLGVPKGINTEVARGTEIQKMGRTTTFSVAQVLDVHLRVPATYPNANGTLGRVGFSDVVMTSFYTSGGDSGSGVLDMDNNVVGLHMAGSPVIGIFCKIGNVLDQLGVEVVTEEITDA